MDLFRREIFNKNDDANKEKLEMIKKENLGAKDVLALIIASMEILLPFVGIGVLVYIAVMLVLTNFWL